MQKPQVIASSLRNNRTSRKAVKRRRIFKVYFRSFYKGAKVIFNKAWSDFLIYAPQIIDSISNAIVKIHFPTQRDIRLFWLYKFYFKKTRRDVKVRLRCLTKLKTISEEDKKKILKVVRRGEIINVSSYTGTQIGMLGIQLFLSVIIIIIIIAYLILFVISIRVLDPIVIQSALQTPFDYLLVWVLFLLSPRLAILLSHPFFRHYKSKIRTFPRAFEIVFIVLCMGLLLVPNNFRFNFQIFGVLGIYILVCINLGEAILNYLRQISIAWENKIQEEFLITNILHRLIHILGHLEKHRLCWYTEFTARKYFIVEIELVSQMVEKGLPGYLQFGDATKKRELQTIAKEIAEGFRSLSSWAYTPKEDTHDNLKKRIASSIILIAQGNWDGIPRVPVLKNSNGKTFMETSKVLLSTMLLAGLPVSVIGLLHRIGMLDDSTIKPALLGSIIWAGLIILNKLDPLMGGKLTSFKELSGVIPMPWKGKE